ncbi:MAG: hypothetical protein K6G08_10900, partial [Prevotella sp.]|nr:hypothetical protein [Prevotella sp.]
MKRHILIMWAFLLPLLALAQGGGGYDPENPPQPNWPEGSTAKKYMLNVESIPGGAGQFGGNANSKQPAGKSVYVYAYDHDGNFFHEWKDAEGNTLTTEREYKFTMPEKDITLYAIYSYDPTSPIQPEYVKQFMLSLKSEPLVAGTFNF